MKGIELSECFYREYGEPMLKEKFPHLLGLIAVGIAGSGSECFGFDDEISQDHDFEPGFCIFLPSESVVDRRSEFELERAYSKLPGEFMGYKRSQLSAVGGNRHGVMRMEDFFVAKTGKPDGALELGDWFFVPEQSLAEATNGKVFFDGLGELTRIRERLAYLPEDVRLKKLAGNLLLMGQSGQYNYGRCISRGETGAAQLAVHEFAKSAMNVAFLLNKRYAPYYKWSFRAMRELEVLGDTCEMLEYLISSANREAEVHEKKSIIEEISRRVAEKLKEQGLTALDAVELEAQAYAVNNKIKDSAVRNLHVLYAV